jgi:hypothetical protein
MGPFGVGLFVGLCFGIAVGVFVVLLFLANKRELDETMELYAQSKKA